jgi:SAM-dependent methyltransferase
MTAIFLNHDRVAFREIGPWDSDGLAMVASMHMELLGFGPMAGLGERFIREICYRTHMQDESLRVVIAAVDGHPAGFVAYTPISTMFHRNGLRRHLVRVGVETMLAVVTRPSRLTKLMRALRVLGSRRAEKDRIDESMGEVVCVAVRPEYLRADVARMLGMRLSESLIMLAADNLRRFGTARMRMIVDATNRPVLMLYHLLGASFLQYWLGGERVVEVSFELSKSLRSLNPGIPDAWSKPAAALVQGDSWRSYWELVGERTRVFEAEARDHVERLMSALAPDRQARVLDFGCGFGHTARFLAPEVGHVMLWDQAASVRYRARLRTAHLGKVGYADLTDPGNDPVGEFDVIVVHSVIQYMTELELRAWLGRWRTMLAPGGQLVLSDLIQPGSSAIRELLGFMAFSLGNGLFIDALRQGMHEIAGYLRARSRRPLLLVTPGRLRELASPSDWSMEILLANLSHRRNRTSVVLRRTSGVQAGAL